MSFYEFWYIYGDVIIAFIAFLNLIAFTGLTGYVIYYENRNSNMQMKEQKKILVAQIRINEINRLSTELDKPFTSQQKSLEQQKSELIGADTYLINFRNQFYFLLPKIEDEEFKTTLDCFSDKLAQLADPPIENLSDEEYERIVKAIDIKIEATMYLKNYIIAELQKYTINELGS